MEDLRSPAATQPGLARPGPLVCWAAVRGFRADRGGEQPLRARPRHGDRRDEPQFDASGARPWRSSLHHFSIRPGQPRRTVETGLARKSRRRQIPPDFGPLSRKFTAPAPSPLAHPLQDHAASAILRRSPFGRPQVELRHSSSRSSRSSPARQRLPNREADAFTRQGTCSVSPVFCASPTIVSASSGAWSNPAKAFVAGAGAQRDRHRRGEERDEHRL